MLGVVGFIAAAVAITLFVSSTYRAYGAVNPFKLRMFVVAFSLMAGAMLLWAAAVAINDAAATSLLVLATDCLILAGTICMILVVRGSRTPLYFIVLLAILAALLIGYRAFEVPPTAYVSNGLLYFNLDGVMRLVVVGIFAIIWMPASMYFAALISKSDNLLRNRQLTLQMYFVALTAIFGVFARARREDAIIFLFCLIVVLFLAMYAFNLTVMATRVKLQKGVKHHAAK